MNGDKIMKYFGTDGVRGVANKDLSPELAFKCGRAGGYILTKHSQAEGQPQVLVARDTRISGQMLESALIAGLLSVELKFFNWGLLQPQVLLTLLELKEQLLVL